MTDTTTTERPPGRIKTRTRRAPTRPRQRRRLVDIRSQRARQAVQPPTMTADLALHDLMRDGDVIEVGRRRYLVAQVNDAVVDRLILASAINEDDEPESDAGVEDAGFGEFDNCDDEPSVGSYEQGVGLTDLELDEGDGSEPDLGWANTGPQLRLVSADEGDGDCDREDDDPGGGNVEDGGELDPCDLGEPEEQHG